MTTTTHSDGPGRPLPEGWSVHRMVLTAPPRHPVAAAVAAAHHVMDAALAAPVWSLTEAETDALLTQLHTLSTKLTAQHLRVLSHADTVHVGSGVGATSTTAHVAVQSRTTRPAVARQVRLAHALDTRWAGVATAMAHGTVNAEQAHEIVRALDALPDDLPDALPDGLGTDLKTQAEDMLIGYAADHDAATLRVLGRKILDVIAPEIGEAHEAKLLADQEARAAAKTRFTMTDDGHGSARGRFTLPSAVAAILRKHLLALAAPARRRATDTTNDTNASEQERAEQTARDRARLTPEKMGQAFADYITRYPADHTPDAGGVAATVVVTINLDDLLQQYGVATLDTGTPITADLARKWACEAQIIPVVLGGKSEVLDLGHTSRFHNKTQRIAMTIRDGGCTADGCDWPPGMCHAHHDDPWSHGGPTDLDHARLLCPRHHARVHDPTYTVTHLQPGVPGGKIAFHRRV